MRRINICYIILRPEKVKLIEIPKKTVLFSVFSRSLDEYYLDNSMINVVDSVFYTDYIVIEFNKLKSYLKYKNAEILYLSYLKKCQ